MAARLGNVIYWACCGIAALLIVVIVLVSISPGDEAGIWIGVYSAGVVLTWLFGRAARYILAGR